MESHAHLICRQLGHERAVDWFGIPVDGYGSLLEDSKFDYDMMLNKMTCPPGTNDLKNCTYQFYKCANINHCGACSQFTITREKPPTRLPAFLALVCNPKPG